MALAAASFVGNAAKTIDINAGNCYDAPAFDAASKRWSVSITECGSAGVTVQNTEMVYLTTMDGKTLQVFLETREKRITLTEVDFSRQGDARVNRRQGIHVTTLR